jgi:hypothetical protein
VLRCKYVFCTIEKTHLEIEAVVVALAAVGGRSCAVAVVEAEVDPAEIVSLSSIPLKADKNTAIHLQLVAVFCVHYEQSTSMPELELTCTL